MRHEVGRRGAEELLHVHTLALVVSDVGVRGRQGEGAVFEQRQKLTRGFIRKGDAAALRLLHAQHRACLRDLDGVLVPALASLHNGHGDPRFDQGIAFCTGSPSASQAADGFVQPM